MPKIEKAERRDRKQKRDRDGMRVSGRSVKTLEHVILRKAEKAARDRERQMREAKAADDGYYER
jgi:hypothetical protein